MRLLPGLVIYVSAVAAALLLGAASWPAKAWLPLFRELVLPLLLAHNELFRCCFTIDFRLQDPATGMCSLLQGSKPEKKCVGL